MRLSRLFILLLLLLSNVAFAQQTGTHFILNGRIGAAEGAMVRLVYSTGLGKVTSKTKVEDGKFKFTGEIQGIAYAKIIISMRQLPEEIFKLFIEPGSLNVDFSSYGTGGMQVTGSSAQDAFVELEQQKKVLADDRKAALSTDDEANDWMDIAYVARHPKAPLSVYLLDLHQERLIVDTAEAYYNKLPAPLKASVFGLSLARKFAERRRGEVGQPAFNFTAIDVNKQRVELKAYKGRYVLLDFWASWCLPCRIANPHLVKLYQQFHAKGIDFIGIADDTATQTEWKAAIKTDKIGSWRQVLAGSDPDKKLTGKFGVFAYPTKILINPQGIIIGRYGEDEQELTQQLQQLFDKKSGKK